ncbi:MAG: hypothetical protein DMH00_09205 [Acidobacteria bacterium]|nr:MAG: hypothetical protein DMH00_09205 [Acidobacteriota bacterium]
MTNGRAVSRALLAGAIALTVGAAFLRMTCARHREAQQNRARAIGADFAHRLETEFQRLAAVSETLALFAAGEECESLQPFLRRLSGHFPSIQGVRLERGVKSCEVLDPRRFPAREMSQWLHDSGGAPRGGSTTLRGPFVTPGGSKVALVEHVLPRQGGSDEGPVEADTVVVDLLQVVASCGVDQLGNAGYLFAFLRSGGSSPGGPPILGAADLSGERITLNLDLPGQSWTLAIARRGGWYPAGTLAAGVALVLALSAVASFSTYGLLLQPELLRREVQRRKERLTRAREELHREAAERAQVQKRLERELTHDQLTGLYNRRSFLDHLTRALSDAGSRQGCGVAVLTFDLDDFAKFNNTLGHAFGDRCIQRVADLLGATLREEHAAARIGPDEFAFLIVDCKSAEIVSRFAGRLQEDLSSPFQIEGEEAAISASIGIAISPSGEEGADELLRDAGIALESARSRGGRCHVLFERTMHSAAMSELRLERDLRAGIRNGELLSVYQPIVDLFTGEIKGFEALIRWKHPERGIISPGEFLPMAEKTGLIIALDRWCMNNALGWLKAVRGRMSRRRPVLLNINLSGEDFSQEDLVDFVARQLHETGVDPASISLEVTESVMMENPERASRILSELKKLRVNLSLDDFGTGYSSLSYLQKFPLDSVKIDRSFIWNISASQKNLEIVRTVVSLTETLGMEVVAEGIETEEQLQLLRSLGCRQGQGFLFSRPVEAQEAERLLLEGIGRETDVPPSNRSRLAARRGA